jgi:hypothetical protein
LEQPAGLGLRRRAASARLLPTTDASAPDITTSAQPWPRTGPGTASDGGLKFDLSQFDPSYFDRLRSRVTQLSNAGIWVGVYLFTGEWLNVYRCAGDGYPLTGGNNVNSIDDGGGNGSMTMTSPNAITAIQDAMADKTVDTLNDLPNVLWIVSEEAAASTLWWQGHMIAHVRAYEATKPRHHPIGLAAVTGAQDSTIYDSDADWVAPFAKLSPSTTCGNGTPKCKVNVNDSDHSYLRMWNDTPQQNRQYAWENFARGNQVIFMDPYLVYYPRQNRNLCASPKDAICSGPDARWNNFRDNLGYILSYSRRLNLNLGAPARCAAAGGRRARRWDLKRRRAPFPPPLRHVDRRAHLGRDRGRVFLIRVFLARPKETAQPVAAATRNDMHVHVRYALAHAVVDRDECPLGSEALFERAAKLLHAREEPRDLVWRDVRERRPVRTRDEQHVTREEWARVEKCQTHLVLENDVRRRLARHDRTEHATVCPGHCRRL